MLERKLAQKIADEVMKSLGYNINVMNENAIIIGSGSLERIGTYHEAAMKAISLFQTCEVSEEEAIQLQGVRPGINMPIVDKTGKIIGVVGITGKLEDVRNIGKLVKMTAELIIEQQESMNRFYTHRNDKDIFINTLISDRQTVNNQELNDWGKRMGYELEKPRVALIITEKFSRNDQDEKRLEKLLERIKLSAFHLKQDISTVMTKDYILIFKTIKSKNPWEIEKNIYKYLAGIMEMQDIKKDESKLNGFVGGYYTGVKGYQSSYNEAYNIYKHQLNIEENKLYFAHHYYFWELYNHLSDDVFVNVIEPYIEKIHDDFGKGTKEAMETMRCLVETNFQYDLVAKKLFIHKNTVIFRRKKMEECLGISIKSMKEENLLFVLILNHYEEMESRI